MSERAGSMPPMTSMTRSMSSRLTSACASVVIRSAGKSTDLKLARAPDRDACQFEACARACREVVGVLGEDADDRGSDDTAAEQRDTERGLGFSHRPSSSGLRICSGDRACRRLPSVGHRSSRTPAGSTVRDARRARYCGGRSPEPQEPRELRLRSRRWAPRQGRTGFDCRTPRFRSRP